MKSVVTDIKQVHLNVDNESREKNETIRPLGNNKSGNNVNNAFSKDNDVNEDFAEEFKMLAAGELQPLNIQGNEIHEKGYDSKFIKLLLHPDKGPESEKKARKVGRAKIVSINERANLSIVTPLAVIDKIWYPNDRQKQSIISDISDLKPKAKGDESSVLSSVVDGDCIDAVLELRDNYISMVLRNKLTCFDLTDVKITKFPELIPFIKGPKASGTASRPRVIRWGISDHMKYMRDEAKVSHIFYMVFLLLSLFEHY